MAKSVLREDAQWANPGALGLACLCICWGIFAGYVTIGALRISFVHVFVFASLTVLFFLLTAHFYRAIPAIVPGIEGIFCGAAAVYGSAVVVMHEKYERWVFPIRLVS